MSALPLPRVAGVVYEVLMPSGWTAVEITGHLGLHPSGGVWRTSARDFRARVAEGTARLRETTVAVATETEEVPA